MPVVTDIDTRSLSPAERFPFWLSELQRRVVPVDVTSPAEHDFVATMRVIDLGPVRVATYRLPPLNVRWVPPPEHTPDVAGVALYLNLAGQVSFAQSGRRVRVDPGDFVIVGSIQPFELSHGAGPHADRHPSAVMIVAETAVLPHRRHWQAHVIGVPTSGRTGVGAMLHGYLATLSRHCQEYHPADVARLGTVARDLLELLLTQRSGNVVAPVAADLTQQGVFARIQAYIERHLRDPELCPGVIAAAHHVSLRTLHRLFRAHGITVAGWVRTRRLERSRRDLETGVAKAECIHRIAARWGFRSPAHFSRSFREAFGASPQEYRERHAHPGVTGMGMPYGPAAQGVPNGPAARGVPNGPAAVWRSGAVTELSGRRG